MHHGSLNIEQLRHFLKEAKFLKKDDETEDAYTIFSNALDALSIVDKYKIYELKMEVSDLLLCGNYLLRKEAITTLCFSTRWHLEEFKDVAYELWLKDENDLVKSTSLQAWTAFYMKTKNEKVLKKLYEIFINKHFSATIRATAYSCIFKIIDRSNIEYNFNDFDKLIKCKTPEEFNRNVNWDAVNQLMLQYAPEALKK